MENKHQHLLSQFLHFEGCFHSQKVVIVCNKLHFHLRMVYQVNLAQKTH